MADLPSPIRHVVGCMTGTSLDGLDAALIRITGVGLAMSAKLIDAISWPFEANTRATLARLATGDPAQPIDYLRAARTLGVLHAAAIEDLLARRAADPTPAPDFVVAHGQTIWHAPHDRLSWQLLDPWPIVRHLGLPVCYDLRQADLIAGGQGAPITPMADWVMYRGRADHVVNLGGIANLTTLGPEPQDVQGGDMGPCNLLLDGLCRRLTGQSYDQDGRCAGEVSQSPEAMAPIAAAVNDRLAGQASLGRELFDEPWLDALAASLKGRFSPPETLHAAVRVVAGLIVARTTRPAHTTVVLAGGGARNQTLHRVLSELHPGPVQLSDDLGIPAQAREAMGFAVLGALCQDRVPISLPLITGADHPGLAGAWIYPPPEAPGSYPRVTECNRQIPGSYPEVSRNPPA